MLREFLWLRIVGVGEAVGDAGVGLGWRLLALRGYVGWVG